MKILHHTIEQLRAPKFHHLDKLIEDIETHYIPKIQEILLPKVIEIDSDLLIAKNTLSVHKNLQEEFNIKIKDGIMKKINMGVYSFSRNKKIHNFDVKKCDLFSIIFPSEVIQNLDKMFKPSILLTGQEIINDDFNKLMETSFQPIYTMLEDNLIQ